MGEAKRTSKETNGVAPMLVVRNGNARHPGHYEIENCGFEFTPNAVNRWQVGATGGDQLIRYCGGVEIFRRRREVFPLKKRIYFRKIVHICANSDLRFLH
jgi:hypothetical protein